MKKFFLYFTIFFSVILIAFFLEERISFYIQTKQYSALMQKALEKTGEKLITYIAYNDNTFDYYHKKVKFHFRKPSIFIKNYSSESKQQLGSIIVAGCSYVHGANLMYKDTFAKILSDYTGRNVYNFAIDGGSPREFLYILRNKDIVDDLINQKDKKNIDYIIYVFIPDQLPRLYCNLYKISPAFKLNKENNQLTFFKQKIFFSGGKFIIFHKLHVFYVYHFIKKEKSSSLFSIYMKECNKEIKKIFGEKTKFIILLYDIENYNWENITALEEDNIVVININDIVNCDLSKSEYRTFDELHPNKEAWEIIVPALTKELKLKENN